MTQHYSLRDWEWMIRTGAYGEDPARRNEFIYHVPEYDDKGNLIGGDPEYYRSDPTPSSGGHANRQPGSFGLGTSFKDDNDVQRPGPAEVVPDFTSMDTPGSWGPDLAGEIDEHGIPEGASRSYPYPPAEQLKKDTAWAIGPHRSFVWPGGQEAAERGHNIMGNNGFVLENSGTDDVPVPSYRHLRSDARVEPSGDEDAPWSLHSPHYNHEAGEPYGTTNHTSPVAAATEHSRQYVHAEDERVARQRQQEALRRSPSNDYQPQPSRRSPRGTRRPGYRGKNIYDALQHATGTASHRVGPDASWDLLNKGTTYGGHPSELVNHPSQNGRNLSTGQLDNWVAQQYQSDLENGRIKHVIYHHKTPLAWKNFDLDENGAPSSSWVIPDERYSQTSSKRQSAIRSNVQRSGDTWTEPYNPDRGFPRSHHQGAHPDAPHGYLSRSQHAQDTVNSLAAVGFHRPSWNSRQTPVFIRPTTETEDQSPYGYSRRRVHGVYMRPVDGPRGAAWVVGEHDTGTNKVAGSKRLNTMQDALAHADRMHQWISEGSQGEPPAIADQSDAAFRRDIRRRRGLDAPLPRTPAQVLPGQQELPFHASSVADWSEYLRG